MRLQRSGGAVSDSDNTWLITGGSQYGAPRTTSTRYSTGSVSRACHTLQKNCVEGIEANREFLAKRVRESVTLVTALNPLIGYEKAALIAKTALASGGAIAEVAESLGIMSRAEMEALLVPEKLTQPMRLVTPAPSSGTKTA